MSAKIILVGNYPKDKQVSMKKFCEMLAENFAQRGFEIKIWKPIQRFGLFLNNTNSGLGKWLGYIDKWIVFPLYLRWQVRINSKKDQQTQATVFYHICDHSNAPYLAHLPRDQTSITCHDVLAIRGALGDPYAYCPSSKAGKYLQLWILKNLSQASKLASVSNYTLSTLKEVTGGQPPSAQWRVIENAINADFRPIPLDVAWSILKDLRLKQNLPFILHVGSALQRKNRKMLIQMVGALDNRWEGLICFAGQPLDEKLRLLIRESDLASRVVTVVKPDNQTLNALYSACEAFIFPSYSEGFGWPLIEAQACGAPVIASNRHPMLEVSGGAALHADPDNPEAFAQALLELQDPEARNKCIQAGFENCRRFSTEKMTDAYIELITSVQDTP